MAFSDFIPDLQWQVFTPELVVLLFALLAPIVATWDNERKGMMQFALTGLVGAFLLTLGSVFPTAQGPGLAMPNAFGLSWLDFNLRYIQTSAGADFALAKAFMVTEASQIFKLVFLAVAIVAVAGVGKPLRNKSREDYGEFFALVMFATLGMMIVASARDMMVLFLGIETASFSSYLLAGFRRDAAGAEAGLKYFTIGAIASGMTLFAISLLYGMAGTTHIPSLGLITSEGPYGAAGIIAIVFLLIGLGFKISSVPAHAWAPDVYSGAPVPVTAMLASASKAMGFVAVFNVFLVGLFGLQDSWELGIAAVAAVTMFVGNLIALKQQSVRRMLAYSSIAQAGYLLIAVAVGTAYALGGGVFHLMVNAAMKLGAFLIVGALLAFGIPDRVDGYKGLARKTPFMAFAMAVFMLSMAGLPPLGGFMSKFVLFSSAIDAGVRDHLGWLVWLAVVAVVNSAISLYYYARVIRAMYVEGDQTGDVKPLEFGTGVTLAVMACLVAVIVMGLSPGAFIDASMRVAQDMLAARL